MRASQMTKYGGTDAIVINNDLTIPIPTEGKVLIKIEACGVNPFDWKLREGYMQNVIPLQFHTVLGGDVAGTIKEVGTGIMNFKIGDKVFGQAMTLAEGSGAFAEFAVAPVGRICHIPKNMDSVHASALPLSGVSALAVITEHMKLQKGQKILIHGGAGGIGSYAIQIARHMGAYTVTTAKEKDIYYVLKLGADKAVNYEKEKFEDSGNDFDAVFDTIGGETHTRSYAVLKKGGILVSMVEAPNADLVEKYGVTAIHQQTDVTADRLNDLKTLAEANVFKVNIDKIFPLEQTGEALTYLKEKSPRGKVVIKIK